MYVCVCVLLAPRCLVEIQPLLLDVTWIDQQAVIMNSDEDEAGGLKTQDSVGGAGLPRLRRSLTGSSRNRSLTQRTLTPDACHASVSGSVTSSELGPISESDSGYMVGGAGASRASSDQLLSSSSAPPVPPQTPAGTGTVTPLGTGTGTATPGGPGTGAVGTPGQLSGTPIEAPPSPAPKCSDVMVTTVYYQHTVLRSIFHLPVRTTAHCCEHVRSDG